jgi:hypothetical protein
MTPATQNQDEWTLSRDTKEGERLSLAAHKVRVVKVLDRRADYAICRVEVISREPDGFLGCDGDNAPKPTPPLRWKGELSQGGRQ